MKLLSSSNSFQSFLIRTILFLIIFVILTGSFGPWIISTRLLYPFYFFIYGNLGKLVIILSVAFLLLIRKQIYTLPPYTYSKSNLFFFIPAILCIPLFLFLAHTVLQLSSAPENPLLVIASHGALLAIPICFALGIYGLQFLISFIKRFKKELVIALCVALVFDLCIFYLWQFWPYLSRIVLQAVLFLLHISGQSPKLFPPLTIVLPHFGITIEQACSGIDSLLLFTGLYIFIGIVEREQILIKRMILLFIPAAIGLFLINILRVYLLIMLGIFISPHLSLVLFHTYAGLLFFLLYFGTFLLFLYPYLKRKKKK